MALHAFNSDIQFPDPLTLFELDVVVVGSQGYVYGQGDLFVGVQDYVRISVAGTIATDRSHNAITLGAAGDPTNEAHLVVTATGVIP